MHGAAVGPVVVEVVNLNSTAVDCSIHLAQGSIGLAAAVVAAVDEEGILDVADIDGGGGEGEVVELAEEEDMKTR